MRKIASTIFVLSFVYGCSIPKFSFYDKVPNSSVAIGTEGVSIKAIDGSFEWVSGNDYNLPASTPYFEWYTTGAALNIKTTDFNNVNETNAIKVMVTTPYSDKPLYGMLQFSKIITECKDKAPETRSYYIQVPEQYVRSAQGGKVSVIYESYMCISGQYSNGIEPTNQNGYSTWVLWLSDRPLSGDFNAHLPTQNNNSSDSQLNSNNGTGEIYITRSTGFQGALVDFPLFIDNVFITKIGNKRYYSQKLSQGIHTVAIQVRGKSIKKKTKLVTIDVKPNEVYFIDIELNAFTGKTTGVIKNGADLEKLKKVDIK